MRRLVRILSLLSLLTATACATTVPQQANPGMIDYSATGGSVLSVNTLETF